MHKEIYSFIINELRENYKEVESFCKLDEAVLQSIAKKSTNGNPLSALKEEIRKAISTFFTECGFKAFLFFKTNDALVLNLKIVNFEENIFLERMAKDIPDVAKYLQDSANKDDIKFLESTFTDKLSKIICPNIEKEQRKEIIRSYIKKNLSLNPRDAIFFISGRVMIKYFKESEAAKRMFDTISEETLVEIEKRASKDGLEQKIKHMVKDLLQNDLNVSRVDNLYFAKNLIKLLQEKYLKFLPRDVMQEEPLTQQGYANYILRNNFDKTMLLIAKHLLEGLAAKDRYVETFIRFYNGETTFSPSGKRFQKSDIVDKLGQRWNGSTLLQVVLQRKKGLEKIKCSDNDIASSIEAIERVDNEVAGVHRKIEKFRDNIAFLEEEFTKKVDISAGYKENIVKYRTELQKCTNEEKKREIQEKINENSLLIKKASREEEQAVANKKKNELEIERAEIKLKTLAKDRDAYTKKLEKNREQKEMLIEKQKPYEQKYEEVAEALAKAISSFRGV